MTEGKCPYCDEEMKVVKGEGDHWCVPLANWTTTGMLKFIRQTINTRERYKDNMGKLSRVEHQAALDGFSSCIIMTATMVAELCLKTLLIQQQLRAKHPLPDLKSLGHDLLKIYDKLDADCQDVISRHYANLETPYCNWVGSEDIRGILEKEKDNFIRWRYLPQSLPASKIKCSNSHETISLATNPYHLAAVTAAIYYAHVEMTDLPSA